MYLGFLTGEGARVRYAVSVLVNPLSREEQGKRFVLLCRELGVLQSIEQPKLTVRDVRRLMEAKPAEPVPPPLPPPPPQPAIEYPVKTDPEPQPESPGGGEWTTW